MSVLALGQTSFWLGVLVTVIAQLWAVTVAVAEFVAAGDCPKASPWTAALFVLALHVALPILNVTAFAAPGFSVVLLPLAASKAAWAPLSVSSLTLTFVRSTSPVLVTT